MAAHLPLSGRHRPRRYRWWWLLAWLVATVCVAVFLHTLDWRATLSRLADADPRWIVVALFGHFITLPLLAEQWFRLSPPSPRLGRRALWESVTIGMSAMNTLPFGGGHALTVGMLISRGMTIEGSVSLMALEQLCDGVAKLALLLAALALAPLPPVLQRAAWLMAAALMAGFVALVWLAKHPNEGGWLQSWRVRWAQPLQAVRRPGILVVAIALSLLGKIGGLVAVYAVHRSLAVNLPISTTPVVLAAVTFATLMALSPGSVGVFEMAAIAAYRLIGVPTTEAATLALVQHACFLLPNIGTGYGIMLWRTLRPRRLL